MRNTVGNIFAKLIKGEGGGLLLETVIAVMVLGAVGTAVLTGLSTSQTSGSKTERQSIAENIARNQMEFAASLPYQPPPYNYPTVSVPAGYSVTAEAIEDIPGDSEIQKITVTVSYNGEVVLSIETFRANVNL